MIPPETGGSAYADAVASFAELAIDDLIVSADSASLGSLDRLAEAATPWL